MRIIVFGGDGFCGCPTTLKLLRSGHEITVVDNLSRRQIDVALGSNSLTEIAPIESRIETAKLLISDKLDFINLDVANDVEALRSLIERKKPEAVVQFAEQRAAPYSMISDDERRYTVNNNVSGTHNLCSAIVDIVPDCHLIHLGTMGVYGYSKEFGAIPEGYLDITINETSQNTEILYPANPGSIYHMTKCLDQLIFQFYVKNWGLSVTDLHQGIVWGVETEETGLAKELTNRFDYDGIYGTVLNRFISQALNGQNLTVYGTGGQSRAFIHISDTAKCIQLAAENPPLNTNRVRIFNQVSEVQSVLGLAKIVSSKYNVGVDLIENPRKELVENELIVSNQGLRSLGFQPVKLNDDLLKDTANLASNLKSNFNKDIVLSSPKW